MTYAIHTGHFRETRLDGVTFVVVAQSKAIMSAGEWVMGIIVDQSASAAQVSAIAEISGGKVGGPLAGFAPLVADFRGIEQRAITFQQLGAQRSVMIAGMLDQAVEGIPSLVAAGECLAIDNTFHPANKRLNLAKALRSVINCFGIRWDDTSGQRNGHFAPFAWQG